jgi:hypothetical protein
MNKKRTNLRKIRQIKNIEILAENSSLGDLKWVSIGSTSLIIQLDSAGLNTKKGQ